ncbi:MAG: GntR family transcriptional regulator [Clostridiales Family XIII bacterium]|nr:GntR family transcriptional regulator [Clostridiales Family XIII bacterium]
MKAALDGNSPIFQQVKDAIEEEILSGALAPGEQIPSNRKLVALWEVNPMTVMKGVQLLVDEGILYKKRGEGMFVGMDAPERLRGRIGDKFSKEHVEPLVRLAAALGMGLDDLQAQIVDVWEGLSDD